MNYTYKALHRSLCLIIPLLSIIACSKDDISPQSISQDNTEAQTSETRSNTYLSSSHSPKSSSKIIYHAKVTTEKESNQPKLAPLSKSITNESSLSNQGEFVIKFDDEDPATRVTKHKQGDSPTTNQNRLQSIDKNTIFERIKE